MTMALKFAGLAIIVYTMVAVALGLPRIADFIPIEWFSPVRGDFYKVVSSSDADYFSWCIVGFGLAAIGLGYLLGYFRRKSQ